MSKVLEALAKLLVKGSRIVLDKFTVDGIDATHELLKREQLVVDRNEDGTVTLMVSSPKNSSELGHRYLRDLKEVEVDGARFTITEQSPAIKGKPGPKFVYHYSTDAKVTEHKPAEKPAEAPVEKVETAKPK